MERRKRGVIVFIATNAVDGEYGIEATLKSSEHGHDVFGGLEVEAKLFTTDMDVHTTSSVDKDSPTRSVAFLFESVDDARDLIFPIPHNRCAVARVDLTVRTVTGGFEVENARGYFDITNQMAIWQQLSLISIEFDGTITTYHPSVVRVLVLIEFPE